MARDLLGNNSVQKNLLLSPDNYLFRMARSGKRLPHIILAIVLTFVFVFIAQIGGGIALISIWLLSLVSSGSDIPLQPNQWLEGLLPDTALEQTISLILLFGPIFLILWGWLSVFEKRPFWTIGVERKEAWRKYLRGLFIGLLMFAVSIGLSASLGFIAFEEGDPQKQGIAALGGVLLVFFGWMVQGAAEETLTRGWLLPVVGARYSPLLGILISALVFAVLHSLNPSLSLIAVMNLALFGLFTAIYALYEGGMWGVFSIHSAWNWAQMNLFGFEVSGNSASIETLFNLAEVGPDFITGGAFGPEGGLSVTVVLIIGCVFVWLLAVRRSRSGHDL